MLILKYSEEFESELVALSCEEGVAGFVIGWKPEPPLRFIEQVRGRVPLLIGSFEPEGDLPVPEPVPQPPTQMAASAAGEDCVRLYAQALGSCCAELGFNAIAHPITEVSIHPRHPFVNVWSFGADPVRVERMALAFLEGLKATGVVPFVRYFPGYGFSTFDPEKRLGGVTGQVDTLLSGPLRPVIESARNGPLVLSHTLMTSVDPLRPVSLSEKAVGLLRRLVGERAILLSDYVDSEALVRQWGAATAGRMACEAGVDGLFVRSPGAAREILRSVRHSPKLARLGASPRVVLGSREREAVFRQIAERGVATAGVCSLPLLLRGKERLVTLATIAPGEENRSRAILAGFVGEIEPRVRDHSALLINLNPTVSERRHIVVASENADAAILIVYAPWKGWFLEEGKLRALVLDLIEYRPRVIVALVGNPYVFREFPEARGCVATFSPDPYSIRHLARVILGDAAACGAAPVPIA